MIRTEKKKREKRLETIIDGIINYFPKKIDLEYFS
jgi:hypothetical protein